MFLYAHALIFIIGVMVAELIQSNEPINGQPMAINNGHLGVLVSWMGVMAIFFSCVKLLLPVFIILVY